MSRESMINNNIKEYITEAEAVVVGAGGAGLTAALTLEENGASVILLEKSDHVGGNTLATFSGINSVEAAVQKEAGVTFTVEDMIARQMNNDAADRGLVEVFCEESGPTVDWLASHGADLRAVKNTYFVTSDSDKNTAEELIGTVYDALKGTDAHIYTDMDVTALVTDTDNTVTGVRATDKEGRELIFNAPAVILTTGGFGENAALVRRIKPDLANSISGVIAPTTGEGLLMAEEAGADTVNLEEIQTFPHVVPGYGMITPKDLPKGAIWVNANGKRFTSEFFGINHQILMGETDGVLYCIFNESAKNSVAEELDRRGLLITGRDAEDLAVKLGMDSEILETAVETWNAGCEAGEDEFRRRNDLIPLEGALCAYRFGVGVHYCIGGLRIDQKARVLDKNGNPIKGLFAAGEVTGGLHGNKRLEGSGIAESFVFGRIAGRSAAQADA